MSVSRDKDLANPGKAPPKLVECWKSWCSNVLHCGAWSKEEQTYQGAEHHIPLQHATSMSTQIVKPWLTN